MELIGWVGSLLFSLCAVPQARQCYQQKHSDGINWSFLLMWLFGEILTLIYVLPTRQWPLITNYCLNLACLSIIFYYKIFTIKGKYNGNN